MNENTQKLVLYRIERAFETLREAKNLMNDELWFGTTNRLYYSCFYAVVALLLCDDISCKTHKGTKNTFYQNFILNGIFEKSLIESYNEAFTFRNEGDYLDLVEFSPDVIKDLYKKSEFFVNTLNDYIIKQVNKEQST